MLTIKEILGNQYSDFMKYCTESEKKYPVDIFPSDYVAFRVQYGVSRDYINEIKNKLNNGGDSEDNKVSSVDEVHEIVIVKQTKNLQDVVSEEDLEIATANLTETDIEEVNEDYGGDVDLTDISSAEDDANYDIVKKENNKIIPYDLHTPLYILFGVDNPEKYSNIIIAALDLKPSIEHIIKEEYREYVIDVLRCSIAQLFDFNNVPKTLIQKALKQIQSFLSIEIDSVEMKLRQPSVPFYKLFAIEDIERFKEVSVSTIIFGTRFTNALKEHNIKTLFSLLQLTVGDLQKWDRLGLTSIKDAIVQLEKYIKNPKSKFVRVNSELNENKKTIEKVFLTIENEINGDGRAEKDLDEKEMLLYSKVKDAIDICGKELYSQIINNPEYGKILSEGLREYSAPILDFLERKERIYRDYCSIPIELRNKPAKLFYKVYRLRSHYKISDLDNSDELMTFSELAEKMRKNEIECDYKALECFFQWLKNIDVNNTVKEIFSRNALTGEYKVDESLKDKYWVVLEMRAEGETLENIGSLTDSTRERVRQIEKKYTKQFAGYYQNNEYDLLALIHALRGGDNVLSKNEVQAIVGEKFTNLLWLVLSKGLLDCDLYRYSKDYNSVLFVREDQNKAENLIGILNDLPEMFFDNELEKLVDDLSQKHGVSKELIVVDIQRQYKKYGTLYSQTLPTVAFMCRYVLKMKFPSGFKTGDAIEAKRFQTYLIDIFGEKKGRITTRAIDAKIGTVGVLCDRGKYLHPDYLHVEKWIIDEINAYIETNEKTVVTYSEIFNELRSVLSGSQITNRFMLQGALKFYGCKYKLTKDYITKTQGRSLTDEFEEFAKEYGEFHKTDFFAAFPSLTDANLAMLVGRCHNVFSIDNGYYMHSSVLKLMDKDYVDIKKYLDNVCSEGPINSRYLFEEFSFRFIDFMSRNEISNHTKLFGILTYMFEKEFSFSRPYISKEENESLTNRDVVLKYLEGINSITIEDVVSMCQEKGIRYMSSGYLIRQLSPDFIRINETMLMRYDLTGINDDVILEIVSYVSSRIETNNYCSVSTIKDFLWFPTINIEWNSYVIESIMTLSGDMIKRINMPTTNMANLTSIYVGEEFVECDYVTFVLKILDDAFEKGFFSSKTEMKEYLLERGLINNNNLPNFLESADYYYTDESGVLRRRN